MFIFWWHEWQTDGPSRLYTRCSAHWYRQSSPKNSAVYIEKHISPVVVMEWLRDRQSVLYSGFANKNLIIMSQKKSLLFSGKPVLSVQDIIGKSLPNFGHFAKVEYIRGNKYGSKGLR